MLMSFDTSNIVRGAAGTGDEPEFRLLQQDRANLLARRPITIWGHGSFTRVDNTRNRTGDDARYVGDVWGYNIGADYQLNPQVFAGASLGYSETKLTTTYNTGTYDEGSWTVTPYAVYYVTDRIKLSALAGYAVNNLDQTRSSGSVTSSTDSKMSYTAINGSYKLQPNPEIPLDVLAQVSLLATHKSVEAFAESDGTVIAAATANTRQAKTSLEAAFSFHQGGTVFQPFVKGALVYDLMDPTNSDPNAYDVGGGVRMGNGVTGFNGFIEGQTQLGRDDYDEYSISTMVTYSFGIGGNGESSLWFLSPYVKFDFTGNAQVYASGVEHRNLTGSLSLNLDVMQTVPTAAQSMPASDVMVRAKVRF